MDPLAAIRETFFQECEEQLAELESGLLAMEGGDTDSETINAVFRAVPGTHMSSVTKPEFGDAIAQFLAA